MLPVRYEQHYRNGLKLKSPFRPLGVRPSVFFQHSSLLRKSIYTLPNMVDNPAIKRNNATSSCSTINSKLFLRLLICINICQTSVKQNKLASIVFFNNLATQNMFLLLTYNLSMGNTACLQSQYNLTDWNYGKFFHTTEWKSSDKTGGLESSTTKRPVFIYLFIYYSDMYFGFSL